MGLGLHDQRFLSHKSRRHCSVHDRLPVVVRLQDGARRRGGQRVSGRAPPLCRRSPGMDVNAPTGIAPKSGSARRTKVCATAHGSARPLGISRWSSTTPHARAISPGASRFSFTERRSRRRASSGRSARSDRACRARRRDRPLPGGLRRPDSPPATVADDPDDRGADRGANAKLAQRASVERAVGRHAHPREFELPGDLADLRHDREARVAPLAPSRRSARAGSRWRR